MGVGEGGTLVRLAKSRDRQPGRLTWDFHRVRLSEQNKYIIATADKSALGTLSKTVWLGGI